MKFEINTSLQVLLIAALVAAMSGWLLGAVKSSLFVPVSSPQPHSIDYYVKNFTLTSTDTNGMMSRKLEGAFYVHYADDDTSDVERPMLTTYKNDAPDWHIAASTGWVGPGAGFVQLRGDVVMTRYAALTANNDLQIKTPTLMIFPDNDYAQTDEKVVITNESTTTQGVGMTADLKQKRLQLLAQVKGSYAAHD